MLELRFMAAIAEIQEGDRLVTSGIDGTYPAGLPVATVVKVERDPEQGFAHVVCRPAAGVDRGRYVLVLADDAVRPPKPQETQSGKERRSEKARRLQKKDEGTRQKDGDAGR
jgi:rod shape-determining protein MreC